MIAYYLRNTLSEHGTVNRGVCYQNEEGNLTKVVERTKISKNIDGSITYPDGEGKGSLTEDTLVSMNMWAFKPSYFDYAEDMFKQFLATQGQELKSEFYIPTLVDKLIHDDVLNVKVLDTESDWFGVTYLEDKPVVMDKLGKLIKKNVYPQNLFIV